MRKTYDMFGRPGRNRENGHLQTKGLYLEKQDWQHYGIILSASEYKNILLL